MASALPPSCRLNFPKWPRGLTLGLAASSLTFSVRVKNAWCLLFGPRMDCFFKQVSHSSLNPDLRAYHPRVLISLRGQAVLPGSEEWGGSRAQDRWGSGGRCLISRCRGMLGGEERFGFESQVHPHPRRLSLDKFLLSKPQFLRRQNGHSYAFFANLLGRAKET